MKTNRQGICRTVYEFKNIVIKVPTRRYGWKKFLEGLLANLNEKNVYLSSLYREDFFDAEGYFGKYNSFSEMLCPVLWASWGGWILIMAKADVASHEKEELAERERRGVKDKWGFGYSFWANNGYHEDLKPDNFGYYKNRLVKVDYH